MAHHINWDNIHHYIHDNDVRYKRRLRRKQLYISCSPCIPPVHPPSTLNNLQTVVSHADPDMEMFLEGFREKSDQCLVRKVDDNDYDDVSLEIVENGQCGNNDFWVECFSVVGNSGPVGAKCGSGGDFVDPDVKMFKEDLRVKCGSGENDADPDFKMLMENLVVDGYSFALKVRRMDGSIGYIEYEKDELRKEYQTKGDSVENVAAKKKGDTLRNDMKKRKRGKAVPRGDDSVSTKSKRNVMVCGKGFSRNSNRSTVAICGKGFSRNSNRSTVAKRSSVLKRGDDIEIIFIGNPNEIEEVTVIKNDSSKIIKKNKRPLTIDNGCNTNHLRKSKKPYEKLDRRPCLTRTDHVSNQIDIAGRGRRHVAVLSREPAKCKRTTPGNEQRGLVVQQGEDTANSRFISGIGNIDVMVKEEKLDDTTNVVLVKKNMQRIRGKDSVYDDNLPPEYKSDKKLGKYAEVKEENATSLNYDEEENEYSLDLEILRKRKKKHEKLERRSCLARTDNVSNPMNFAGKATRHLAVLSRQSAKYRRTVPRNEQRDLVVQQVGNIENIAYHVSTPINIAGKAKRHQAVLSRQSAKCRRTGPRNEWRDLVVQQGGDIENIADHVSNPMNIASKAKRHLAVSSRQSAKCRRTGPRDLVVQQGGDIENSRFSSGAGNMDVMVKEEKFDDSTNLVLVTKSTQMIHGRDSVCDGNLRPRYKCDKKFGKYAEVKEENSISFKHDEEDKGHFSDLEIPRKSKRQHEKLERRPCLTRVDHVSDQTDIVGKPKRHLAVMSRQSAKYRKTIPRNERRDLVVWESEDIENSKFSSGTGNMAVMVKEEKFDDSTNESLLDKSMQVIPGRDTVHDNNLRPQYKCDEKFGKYAEVKEENAKRVNYDIEDNEDSSDLEILETDDPKNLSKFELTKVFDVSVIEDGPVSTKIASDYKTSAFRKELMVILKEPFNLEEYRSLMQKAKYRHLNWGPEYSDGLKGKDMSNAYGKSPLDYHPDVQRRLRRCRRISKRLNILRGFIYWYGRTCQDGAFKPWLDKSCLAVTPSPR